MIDWDIEYGVAGILMLLMGFALLRYGSDLGILGAAAGCYALYKSFLYIDPDGV
jgi:hypothetical protein